MSSSSSRIDRDSDDGIATVESALAMWMEESLTLRANGGPTDGISKARLASLDVRVASLVSSLEALENEAVAPQEMDIAPLERDLSAEEAFGTADRASPAAGGSSSSSSSSLQSLPSLHVVSPRSGTPREKSPNAFSRFVERTKRKISERIDAAKRGAASVAEGNSDRGATDARDGESWIEVLDSRGGHRPLFITGPGWAEHAVRAAIESSRAHDVAHALALAKDTARRLDTMGRARTENLVARRRSLLAPISSPPGSSSAWCPHVHAHAHAAGEGGSTSRAPAPRSSASADPRSTREEALDWFLRDLDASVRDEVTRLVAVDAETERCDDRDGVDPAGPSRDEHASMSSAVWIAAGHMARCSAFRELGESGCAAVLEPLLTSTAFAAMRARCIRSFGKADARIAARCDLWSVEGPRAVAQVLGVPDTIASAGIVPHDAPPAAEEWDDGGAAPFAAVCGNSEITADGAAAQSSPSPCPPPSSSSSSVSAHSASAYGAGRAPLRGKASASRGVHVPGPHARVGGASPLVLPFPFPDAAALVQVLPMTRSPLSIGSQLTRSVAAVRRALVRGLAGPAPVGAAADGVAVSEDVDDETLSLALALCIACASPPKHMATMVGIAKLWIDPGLAEHQVDGIVVSRGIAIADKAVARIAAMPRSVAAHGRRRRRRGQKKNTARGGEEDRDLDRGRKHRPQPRRPSENDDCDSEGSSRGTSDNDDRDDRDDGEDHPVCMTLAIPEVMYARAWADTDPHIEFAGDVVLDGYAVDIVASHLFHPRHRFASVIRRVEKEAGGGGGEGEGGGGRGRGARVAVVRVLSSIPAAQAGLVRRVFVCPDDPRFSSMAVDIGNGASATAMTWSGAGAPEACGRAANASALVLLPVAGGDFDRVLPSLRLQVTLQRFASYRDTPDPSLSVAEVLARSSFVAQFGEDATEAAVMDTLRKLQTALVHLRFLPLAHGPDRDVFGFMTAEAVRRFAAKYRIPESDNREAPTRATDQGFAELGFVTRNLLRVILGIVRGARFDLALFESRVPDDPIDEPERFREALAAFQARTGLLREGFLDQRTIETLSSMAAERIRICGAPGAEAAGTASDSTGTTTNAALLTVAARDRVRLEARLRDREKMLKDVYTAAVEASRRLRIGRQEAESKVTALSSSLEQTTATLAEQAQRHEAEVGRYEAEMRAARDGIAELERRRDELQREAEEARRTAEEGKTLCVVCLEKPVHIVLQPCRHVCLCEDCSVRLDECPICRADIVRRTVVFIV